MFLNQIIKYKMCDDFIEIYEIEKIFVLELTITFVHQISFNARQLLY